MVMPVDGRSRRLDTAESVPHALTAVFAMHGRVKPDNKYLPCELQRHPLGERAWRPARRLPLLDRILAHGDADTQRALFREIERAARAAELASVLDGWGTALDLVR